MYKSFPVELSNDVEVAPGVEGAKLTAACFNVVKVAPAGLAEAS